ncbi:MAG TPA: ATP-binding protein [Planctomycetaceae bacterium]|jgi:signal transduction histidine kinase|nr:ATP-binding protein [Planctomycetaceae bacterium]
MKRLQDSSIRAKLILLGTLTAGIALILACIMFVMNDVSATKDAMVQHLNTLADVLGGNCIAALTFNDSKAANDVLASLRFEPTIHVAVVYDRQGHPFATYKSEADGVAMPSSQAVAQPGHVFRRDGTLQIVASIRDNNEAVGTVVLNAGMGQVDARFHRQMLTAIGVLIVSLVLSYLLASRLQKFVSLPIINLATTAERISQSRDFSIRVEKVANDEIGSLYTAFNRMLEQIEAGELELKRSHEGLERRVQERTVQLSEANAVLSSEIVERKRAVEELHALQSEHLDAARRAGMAEIATSVLHNVGNVLNSVNVSASIIGDRMRKFGVADLKSATELLNRHLDDPGAFVSSDPQGKHLPQFLIQLSQKMSSDEQLILNEIRSLSGDIDHIKGIVALQQSYTGVSGISDRLSLADLVDDAIRINSQSVTRHNIDVIREYEVLPPVMTEKQKVLQILVNLLSNAKYAVIAANRATRRITVRLERVETDRVRIEVIDNGVGIPRENLTSIFSHGFTTRKDGHGFGLHSAANLARELGGSLTVQSAGARQGATFRLDLPFKTLERQTMGAHPSEPSETSTSGSSLPS